MGQFWMQIPGVSGSILDANQHGYAPISDRDLIEWVKERSAIPVAEWQQLLTHIDSRPPDDKIRALSINDATLMVALDDFETVQELLTRDLATFLRNWLPYYGPIEKPRIQSLLGVEPSSLTSALDHLSEEGAVISGVLVEGDSNLYWCDADNYEFLLRLLRNRHRVSVEPLPTNRLIPFLHHWQTRHTSEDNLDQLFDVMTQMRGYVASAGDWEAELLPARLPGYNTRDLDQLFQEGDLTWLGVGDKRVAFCFSEDAELMLDQTLPASDILPRDSGRYEFSNLLDNSDIDAKELHDRLWKETWQTRISNDSMTTLRKGLETGFSAPGAGDLERRGKIRRGGFNQWRNAMPFTGNWFSVRQPEGDKDAVELDELGRARVRLLLDRYGILFRELVNREAEVFRWHSLFRSLRLMELSGEVISGYFFKNVAGPQFITPLALRTLQRMDNANTIFWLNATDPISPCGLGLEGLKSVPRRIPSNYLVYHDYRLVMTVERQGKALTISVPPDAPELPRYLEVIRHLLYRSFSPRRKLTIESINGGSAVKSDYLHQLEATFDVAHDHKSVYLQREL